VDNEETLVFSFCFLHCLLFSFYLDFSFPVFRLIASLDFVKTSVICLAKNPENEASPSSLPY
jgi:hypothetical protein